jgi:cardiolipin synthase A/B
MKAWQALRRRYRISLVALLLLVLAGAGLLLVKGCEHRDERAFRLAGRVPVDSVGFDLALRQSLGVTLEEGHRVQILQNGAVFDTAAEQIDRAQVSIHVLMYIWEQGEASDRIVRALVTRARAGVACRIVVDDLGSPDFGETVQPALTAAGCQVRVFRPLPAGRKLQRNHRKLLVIDGRVAITGGFGIRDNWLGNGTDREHWRDTSVLFAGPSVADAQQAFAENWQEAGGALLPGDIFPSVTPEGTSRAAFIASTAGVLTRSERLLQLMLASAERRIWLANAYFVPSPGVIELLERKARAGVDVRLMTPDKNSDSKTAFGAQHLEFDRLIAAGARVWEYTASMLHSKTLVIDDELSLIGSINLDPLSLNELEEVALLVRDPAVAAELAAAFTKDVERAQRVTD